jgi:very-short-patch-repair endonuclease
MGLRRMRGAKANKTVLARRLRKDSTGAEQKLWRYLRSRSLGGFKFVRQKAIGPYVVDFICREKRLVIEVDGSQHAENDGDAMRDRWLAERRYRVLRFWNNEVMENIEGVWAQSSPQRLRQRPLTPTLSPHAGRGRREARLRSKTQSLWNECRRGWHQPYPRR